MDTADTDTRLARQYGGYGNYGGFVECCEGVVDPLFLLTIIVGEDQDTTDTTDTMDTLGSSAPVTSTFADHGDEAERSAQSRHTAALHWAVNIHYPHNHNSSREYLCRCLQ